MVVRFIALLLAGFILLTPAAAHADETPDPSPSPSPGATGSPDAEETPGQKEQEATGPGIGVTLINSSDKSAGPQGTPIPGVTIAVIDEDGDEVGQDVTDEAGQVFVPVEELGTYTVRLDEETLPDDIELNDPEEAEQTKRLTLMAPTFFDFQIGVTSTTTGFAEQLSTGLVSGIKFGLIIALAALGLNLIFGTTGLTNFSHGELVTLGAMLAYGANVGLGVPVIASGAIAVVLAGLFGWMQDRGLWRPLRKRGTGLIAMMIVSIGLGLVLRYFFQYLIGGGRYPFTEYTAQQRVDYGLVELAGKEIWIGVVSVVALTAVAVMLMRTRLGKAMRAVSDNPALAASSGMRVDGVVSAAWILGTALAGLSGVLFAVNSQVEFQMGFKMLLLVFAGATLGGLGTIWGAMVGGMIIGIMVELGPLFGMPTSIKDVSALLILILILLVRPQGILGRRERIG